MIALSRGTTIVLFGMALIAAKGCGGSKSPRTDGAIGTDAAPDAYTIGSTGGQATTGGASGSGGVGDVRPGSGGTGGVGSGGIDGGMPGTGGGPLDATATGDMAADDDATTADGAGLGGIGSGGTAGVASGGSGGSAPGGSGGKGGTGGSGGSGGVRIDGGVGGSGGTGPTGGSKGESCPQTARTNGSACSSNDTCYYEDCAGKGRIQARCSSGAWIVTTAACAPVKCVGFNGAVTLTCAAGQICVAPFGEDPICASHTCGTGPISSDCVSGAKGTCNFTGSTSAADGITLACCASSGTSC